VRVQLWWHEPSRAGMGMHQTAFSSHESFHTILEDLLS
jgi:hypothetical protein